MAALDAAIGNGDGVHITIITVCYNTEKSIAHTIKSVAAQTYTDYEHVIVDGSSSDGTLAVVERFRHPRLRVISEKDHGIYDAMNKGLRLFEGDAVGFLNADDAYHDEHALQSIADALANADVVYGDLNCVADQETKRIIRVWRSGNYPERGFHLGWMPPHPTFYIRRHIVEQVGAFNLDYEVAADYDFMLRTCHRTGARIACVPRTLVDYALGGISSGSLRRIIQSNLESLDSRRRHLGHMPVDAALILRPLRRVPQFLRALMPKRKLHGRAFPSGRSAQD